MTADPRAALSLLVAALERHLEVATSRRDPDDPAVVAAALDLADAFDDYDEALFLSTEVMTPLIVDADDDEDDDDDETDDLDGAVGDVASGGVYSGLEDDDLDYGDDESSDDDDEDEDEDEDDDDDDEDLDEDLDEDDVDDELDDEDDDDDGDDDPDEDELDDDGKPGHLAPSHR